MITDELIQTIYDRAIQYATARYGSEPDKIQLDGSSIVAYWENYCCGGYDVETEYFDASNLTEDLDDVIAQRKEAEEQKRIKQEEENRRQQKLREERELQERKETYIKLKKEFENGI